VERVIVRVLNGRLGRTPVNARANYLAAFGPKD
jgi:hypothetical protein